MTFLRRDLPMSGMVWCDQDLSGPVTQRHFGDRNKQERILSLQQPKALPRAMTTKGGLCVNLGQELLFRVVSPSAQDTLVP